MSTRRRRGQKPSYWPDMLHGPDGTVTAVVETDDPRFPDRIAMHCRSWEHAVKCAADLAAGRRPEK